MDVDTLVEENIKLVGYVANKMMNLAVPYYYFDMDDVFQEGSIGLWKAAQTFKPEKGFTFSTYASRCIQNAILMYFRKESSRKKIPLLTLDQPLPDQMKVNEQLTHKDMLYEGYTRFEKNRPSKVESELLAKELEGFYDDVSRFKQRAPHVEAREKQIYEYLISGYRQVDMKPHMGISQRILAGHFAHIRERIKNDWLEGNAI
jgi:RNA polymerase sigma factor (sigma-70 family)